MILDEIKEKIKQIYFNDYEVLPKYMIVLDGLRPYIKSEKDELKCELADLVINTDGIYILNTLKEIIKYNELINKIKGLK